MVENIVMKNILFILVFLCSISSCIHAPRLVEVGKGYSSTSVNTTVFRNSSLASCEGKQYIAYYDADGWMVLGSRDLEDDEWALHRTQYKGNVKDAHNVISLMVDGDGYLHVSFDHHGHPLNYCRSVAPHSLILGDKEPMTGVDEKDVEIITEANGINLAKLAASYSDGIIFGSEGIDEGLAEYCRKSGMPVLEYNAEAIGNGSYIDEYNSFYDQL